LQPLKEKPMEMVAPVRLALLAAGTTLAACNPASAPQPGPDVLIGAWRSQINASGGELAEMKNLEFMYVFNAGGTMTESSNYDSSPPVPPAYGVWRKTAPREFEAKYAFYTTKPPAAFEEVAKGGGWEPSGYGVLTEKITVAEDGKSYDSTLVYTLFDASGKEMDGGAATGAGVRIEF
jgi:hypothetical protein